LFILGLTTDGAHHKQWCLVKLAEMLAPDVLDRVRREYGDIDEGVAP
jgi:hypothetical protein